MKAWQQHQQIGVVAHQAQLPAAAVKERLVTAGIVKPQRRYILVGSADDPLRPEVLSRLTVGQTAPEIAAAYHLTDRQVRYRLSRYRVPRRRPQTLAQLRLQLPLETLRQLYVDQRLSCEHIAQQVGASRETVRRLLRANGIPRRKGGTHGTAGRRPLNPAVLHALYVRQHLTLSQIAQRLGYLTPAGNPSVRKISKALRTAGLSSRRGQNWADRLAAPGGEIGRSNAADVDSQMLRQLYLERGLSVAAVARVLGWLTPSGRPAVTYTRQRLLATGIVLRRPGRAAAPHGNSARLDVCQGATRTVPPVNGGLDPVSGRRRHRPPRCPERHPGPVRESPSGRFSPPTDWSG